MWLLKDRNGKIKYLMPGKTIHFGRKEADVVLRNDASISRAHAAITVTLKDQMKISEVSSTCIVKDVNSKYGTLVIRNNVQTKASKEGFELKPSDTIKFGLLDHVFTIEYIRFVTVISRLSNDHKKVLKDIMDKIGGIVIDYYDNKCTHLTATTATSTNKIISALITGIPIVDINYWMAVVKAIETDKNLPDTDSFTLTLQDKGVNRQRISLKPNPLRRILFQGKTFIFFYDKAYKEYKQMIKEAGGKVELRTINLNNISEELFEDNTLVMQITDDSITDDLATFNTLLYDKMQERKLRMIAESEIPLAVMYVSSTQYCNPKYHIKELLIRKNPKEDTSAVVALDTQDVLASAAENINVNRLPSVPVCIPETNDFMQEDTLQNEKVSSKKEDDIQIEKLKSNQLFIEDKNSLSNTYIQEQNYLEKNITSNSKGDNNSFKELESVKQKPTIDSFDKKSCSSLDEKEVKLKPKLTNQDAIKTTTKENDLNKTPLKKENKSSQQGNVSNDLSTSVNKGKKRQREKSDDSINLQSTWKTKERMTPIDVNKRRKNLIFPSEVLDDFEELEQHKNEIKKKNKLEKWGFKKSEKKTIDFDLDDFDEMDEPNKECKTEVLKNLASTSKESIDLLDKTNRSKSFHLSENNKINETIPTNLSSINNPKRSKENIEEYTSTKPSKVKCDTENNSLIKNELNKSCLVRPDIKFEPQMDLFNIKKEAKTFKKAYNQIPVRRIALSDMSVWKPNN